MRFLPFILAALLWGAPTTVCAGPAEARDAARQNNCVPKKVEVYQQKMGGSAATLYRVECIEPKLVDEKAPKMPTAMLIQCDGSLCDFLRPLPPSTQ